MVLKLKVCKARDSEGVRCNNKFEPRSPWQTACSELCAVNIIAEKKSKDEVKKARKQRQERREGLEALKTRRDYVKDAQIAFNAWVRARDEGKECIDGCGTILVSGKVGGGFDAGHYRSIGSAVHLRFDERNVHGQAKQCNRWGSGKAVDYRIGLIKRIGLQEVESLEACQEVNHYSIEELKEITKTYRKKLKELKND